MLPLTNGENAVDRTKVNGNRTARPMPLKLSRTGFNFGPGGEQKEAFWPADATPLRVPEVEDWFPQNGCSD